MMRWEWNLKEIDRCRLDEDEGGGQYAAIAGLYFSACWQRSPRIWLKALQWDGSHFKTIRFLWLQVWFGEFAEWRRI